MADSFGGSPDYLPPHLEAELRAADAQRPTDYRNAVDRAGAGVDLRVVIAIVVTVGAVVLFLVTVRP